MAENLAVICEPIVYKMWDPRRLTILWASTACFRDNFTFQSQLTFLVPAENVLLGFLL
jgi:CRISPR-associated Cas5-like protein